jgi:F-type H+-transporting ATPase subunit epsilon
MATTFELEIATPERMVLREAVVEAQIPAREGYLGLLPDHAALLSEMGCGELKYRTPEQTQTLVVCGGWVEVLDNHVRILADSAESPNEIDAARARKSFERAVERINKPFEGMDVARALNAMRRAQARLDATKAR